MTLSYSGNVLFKNHPISLVKKLLETKLQNYTVKLLKMTESFFVSMDVYPYAKNQHHSSIKS